jgi:hypothetical protein
VETANESTGDIGTVRANSVQYMTAGDAIAARPIGDKARAPPLPRELVMRDKSTDKVERCCALEAPPP